MCPLYRVPVHQSVLVYEACIRRKIGVYPDSRSTPVLKFIPKLPVEGGFSYDTALVTSAMQVEGRMHAFLYVAPNSYVIDFGTESPIFHARDN